jgi:hypothetical protein
MPVEQLEQIASETRPVERSQEVPLVPTQEELKTKATEVDIPELAGSPSAEFEALPAAPGTDFGKASFREVAVEAFRNVPSSTVKLAKETVDDIKKIIDEPVETAKAVGKTVLGAAQKLVPGRQEEEIFAERAAEAVGEYFDKQYGTVEDFKRTVAEDPARVMSDVTALVTGVAGAAKTGLKVAGKVVPKSVPRGIVEKSISVPSKVEKGRLENRIKIVEDTLKQEASVSKAGVVDLKDRIKKISDDTQNVVTKADKAGGFVKTKDMFQFLDKEIENFKLTGLETKNRDIAKIEKFKKAFLKNQGDKIPIKKAQAIKQNIDKRLKRIDEKDLVVTNKDLMQDLVDGARKAIADKFPEIGELNKNNATLIELNKAIENTVLKSGARQLFQLGVVGVSAGAGLVTQRPLEIAAAAISAIALSSPRVKVKIAKILEKSRKGIPGASKTEVGGAALGALTTSRAQREQ